jgi:hypothetical protein
MEHDDTPESRPHPPRAPSAPPPTDAELSRIAREAVRQPADPRMDKQLARMGLTDTIEPQEHPASHARGRSTGTDEEVERLRVDLRRLRMIASVLGAVTAALAILVVVLLTR